MSEFDLPGDADNFDIGDKEFKMAKTLVESMAAPWEPERYHDEYREQLLQWIEKKAKSGKKAPAKPEKEDAPERGGELIDFMDLLKQSVDQEKGKHGTKGTSPASKRKSASRKQGASSKKKAQGS
jgi:DNA end-binding protein Ku